MFTAIVLKETSSRVLHREKSDERDRDPSFVLASLRPSRGAMVRSRRSAAGASSCSHRAQAMTAKAVSPGIDPGGEPLPAYDARDLTEGGDRARIVLDGQVYTLRITRAGKLILTK